MTINLNFIGWTGWVSADTDAELFDLPGIEVSASPDAAVIPAMLRRRLGLLGRACASQVMKLVAQGDIPIVYCSQHGDIERTVTVLQELAKGEPVSPMHFSLAVHNAICGVLSIQTGNRGNITALAACTESIVPGLLEAAGMLRDGESQVICVFCDVPLPDIYQSVKAEPKRAYACAVLLSAEQGEHELGLNGAANVGVETSPLELISYLEAGAGDLTINHNGSTWLLRRRAA